MRAALFTLAAHAAGLAQTGGVRDEGADETVTVEADRPDRPDPSRTPASVTVIDIDRKLAASDDLGAVIDSASGTTVQRLGGLGDWSAVSIRGSTFRQVEVCLDGVPLNPDGSDTVNLSELALDAFERIEIYRGDAPPAFAAAPIGGVVNLVTPDSKSVPDHVSVAGGSLRTGRLSALASSAGSLAGRPTDTLLLADLFTTRGDFTYFDDNATLYNLTDDHLRRRENNDKAQLSAHARWRWGFRRLRLGLLDAFLSRDEGVPGPVNHPAALARLTTTRNLGVARLEARAGELSAEVRAWNHLRDQVLDDRQGEVGVGRGWTDGRATTTGMLGHLEWAPTFWAVPSFTLSAYADRWREQDLVTGAEDPVARRTAATGALATTLRAWKDRLMATPVLQGTWLDDRELTDAITRTTVNPRLGVLLAPWPGWATRIALKANAGSYLRPPDLTELYGDQGTLKGNDALVPETGWQWDVGGRIELPEDGEVTGSLDLAHFWNDTRDLITYVQNSQETLIPVNLGQTWVQGVEASLTLGFFGHVDSQTNLTRNVSVNLSTKPAYADKQVPGVPAWEAWQATSVHWGETLRLGHTWSYTDGEYRDAANFYRAAPRSLHGAFARVQPGPRAPSIELDVLNLFDHVVEVVPRNPLDPSDPARVVQPVTDFFGYPLPGRTWLLTVRWSAAQAPPDEGRNLQPAPSAGGAS